jgi:hypothetical protein
MSMEKRLSLTDPNRAIKDIYKLFFSPNYLIDPGRIIRDIVGSYLSGILLNQKLSPIGIHK